MHTHTTNTTRTRMKNRTAINSKNTTRASKRPPTKKKSHARTTQHHSEYNGPAMGPKMATENKRNFTDEDIRKGRDGQIGLQVSYKYECIQDSTCIYRKLYIPVTNTKTPVLYKSTFILFLMQAGQNQGATQAGHGGMGNTRHM